MQCKNNHFKTHSKSWQDWTKIARGFQFSRHLYHWPSYDFFVFLLSLTPHQLDTSSDLVFIFFKLCTCVCLENLNLFTKAKYLQFSQAALLTAAKLKEKISLNFFNLLLLFLICCCCYCLFGYLFIFLLVSSASLKIKFFPALHKRVSSLEGRRGVNDKKCCLFLFG